MPYKSKYFLFILFLILLSKNIYSDSFENNFLNNHGVVGLVNMPSARFLDESSFGFTLYGGSPDTKFTMTSYPFDWLEASVFYTSIENKPYPGFEYQDYKDKGFNLKAKLIEETIYFPSIAIGINDIAGTGLYSAEYIVGSYGIRNLDIHFGLGWGNLSGTNDFKNPLGYLHEKFYERPETYSDPQGGQFQPSRYYSDDNISAFFGLSYIHNEKLSFQIERDTTSLDQEIRFDEPKNRLSGSLSYKINNNFTIGLSIERGNSLTVRFNYKDSPKKSVPRYEYKSTNNNESESKYDNFISNLNRNGIGVNKIFENNDVLGLELTQFRHPSLDIVEEILQTASKDSDINKDVIANYKTVDLTAIETFDKDFENNSLLVYERPKSKKITNDLNLRIRPFIASREGFLKAAVLLENDTEILLADNFLITTNLKYSVYDNFDDLVIPPPTTYPEQVRSDVKDYLRNFDQGVIIGRAQADYHLTLSKNNHVMFTAGILEEMFSGVGFEYLNFDNTKNFATGFEIFQVYKRDYDLGFGHLDYHAVTAHANLYFRNYNIIPFDGKISIGKYLAGDYGISFELARRFENGTEFGIFATFTDVSSEEFGEGSFDKGIFFNIPIFSNFTSYSWRPLTKDPGAKLIRKHSLHDFLVKFRPHNR